MLCSVAVAVTVVDDGCCTDEAEADSLVDGTGVLDALANCDDIAEDDMAGSDVDEAAAADDTEGEGEAGAEVEAEAEAEAEGELELACSDVGCAELATDVARTVSVVAVGPADDADCCALDCIAVGADVLCCSAVDSRGEGEEADEDAANAFALAGALEVGAELAAAAAVELDANAVAADVSV
jgi:hypothetical protein